MLKFPLAFVQKVSKKLKTQHKAFDLKKFLKNAFTQNSVKKFKAPYKKSFKNFDQKAYVISLLLKSFSQSNINSFKFKFHILYSYNCDLMNISVVSAGTRAPFPPQYHQPSAALIDISQFDPENIFSILKFIFLNLEL